MSDDLVSRFDFGAYEYDLQKEITKASRLSDEAVVLITALTITVVLPSASIILYLGYQFYTQSDKPPCQMCWVDKGLSTYYVISPTSNPCSHLGLLEKLTLCLYILYISINNTSKADHVIHGQPLNEGLVVKYIMFLFIVTYQPFWRSPLSPGLSSQHPPQSPVVLRCPSHSSHVSRVPQFWHRFCDEYMITWIFATWVASHMECNIPV